MSSLRLPFRRQSDRMFEWNCTMLQSVWPNAYLATGPRDRPPPTTSRELLCEPRVRKIGVLSALYFLQGMPFGFVTGALAPVYLFRRTPWNTRPFTPKSGQTG
jgi:hypothetical protein